MSDAFQVSGKIIEIFDENVISDKFKKREFILEHAPNPEYPELLKIEVVQNKCDLLEKYKVGQSVNVDINLKALFYCIYLILNNKYLNIIKLFY